MMTSTKRPKEESKKLVYGLKWSIMEHPASIELTMIRHGGRWKVKTGKMVGEGLFHHYKSFAKIVWPDLLWHRWADLQLEEWVKHRCVVVIGPASSGKTCISGAICHLIDYYAFPECTTVICCSTTKERLEDRVWGEIKKWHREAKNRVPWLPGHLIEGRMRITTDPKSMAEEGRDFRNGMIGVPCMKGSSYEGLASFIGVKNKRVRLMGDELHLLPQAFVESLSNLDKNLDFKVTGLGNPKDTTDALGVLAEPAAHLGGWEGGIDQEFGTKKWETRRPDGICIQLWGPDSPNLDGSLPIPLISQDAIDRDVAFYGKESVWFTMMNEGRMPRGQGSRRVLTRQMCLKFRAKDEPHWLTENHTKVAFLDAAYRSVGGDRCIFGELRFGQEATQPTDAPTDPFVSQGVTPPKTRHLLALIDLLVVPIKGGLADLPEDQIVEYVMGQCQSRQIPSRNFFFDAAMRTSLVSAFSRLWSPDVNSIDFMGSADDVQVSDQITQSCKDYYQNKITQVWYDVRLAVEASQIRGMTDDLIHEFSSREWTIVGKNKIQVEPKEKMKQKTGRSPDLADAFAIGVYGARQLGFIISKLTSPKRDDDGPDWRQIVRKRAESFRNIGSLNYAA
jgi:hypothetical protein